MEKPWYKSKTIWTAVIGGVLGVLHAFGVVVPEWVYTILIAFGLVAVRDAIGSNG